MKLYSPKLRFVLQFDSAAAMPSTTILRHFGYEVAADVQDSDLVPDFVFGPDREQATVEAYKFLAQVFPSSPLETSVASRSLFDGKLVVHASYFPKVPTRAAYRAHRITVDGVVTKESNVSIDPASPQCSISMTTLLGTIPDFHSTMPLVIVPPVEPETRYALEVIKQHGLPASDLPALRALAPSDEDEYA